jgi:hypothetical protein
MAFSAELITEPYALNPAKHLVTSAIPILDCGHNNTLAHAAIWCIRFQIPLKCIQYLNRHPLPYCTGVQEEHTAWIYLYTFIILIFWSYLRWGCAHPDWRQDSVWDPCGLSVLLPGGHVPDPTAGLLNLHLLMPESVPPLRSTTSKLEPVANPKEVSENRVLRNRHT